MLLCLFYNFNRFLYQSKFCQFLQLVLQHFLTRQTESIYRTKHYEDIIFTCSPSVRLGGLHNETFICQIFCLNMFTFQKNPRSFITPQL